MPSGVQIYQDDCIGDEVKEKAAAMDNGSVLLLENVRFYSEETKNDSSFAEKLASAADLYVNDAFGTAHRAHASTEGVTKFLSPSVCGFLMQKELDFLVRIFILYRERERERERSCSIFFCL